MGLLTNLAFGLGFIWWVGMVIVVLMGGGGVTYRLTDGLTYGFTYA